jgi:predicted ATP-grasp superfamily ATP-dependent carboligase
MSGPSTHPSPSSGEPENLLVRVERLRQQAEDFQRSIEDEIRTLRALFEEERVRQAKRRGRGGRAK